MPTSSPPRQTEPLAKSNPAKPNPTTFQSCDWRCTRCKKLLGVGQHGRMHLRFSRAHEYFVGFPVQATCRGCGTLNEASGPLI